MYIHKMTEQNSNDKYIKCARCRKKYINNDNYIKINFGYNRLNERYKTCINCRNYSNSKIHCEKCGLEVCKVNLNRHQKTNSCKQWELLQSRVDIHDPDIIRFDYNLNNDPIPVYKDYNKTIEYKEKYLGYDRNKKPMSIEEQLFELGLIESDDDEETKEKKSQHMMKMIGEIKMY